MSQPWKSGQCTALWLSALLHSWMLDSKIHSLVLVLERLALLYV